MSRRYIAILVSLWPLSTASLACTSDEQKSAPSSLDGAAAALGEPLRLSIAVPAVPAGTEGTKCVRIRLGNDAPIHVGKMHNVLSEASHHFVVSTVEDPTLTEAPLFDCLPFRAPLTGAPLMITQKRYDTMTLPEGVAYEVAANQLMHLELHYINTTTHKADISAESEIYPLEGDAKNLQEASFLLIGDLDISIPPHASNSTGPVFESLPPGYDGVTFYALTGHTHRFGTNVTVGLASSAASGVTPLYAPNPFVWDAPEVKYLSPRAKVPSGGGFSFQCDWYNPTDQVITFGESALDEMCFFWAYYYPKQPGTRLLLTGLGKFGGADAGPTLPGPPCAAAGDPGNELEVGKYCSRGGKECANAASFCLADFTKGAFGDFCSKTCSTDADCGAGASCSTAQVDAAAQSPSVCVPTKCAG